MARGQRRRRELAPAPVKGRRRRLKPIKLWREVPLLLAIALVLALGIKTFVVQAFFIPSQSMENTIMVGDRVLVNKFSPWFGAQPQRGQIIVFNDPGGWLPDTPTPDTSNVAVRYVKDVFTFVGLLPSDNQHDLIKRVIGVPGDTVACCDSQGRVTVNGTALSEPYVFAGEVPSRIAFKVTVPAGKLWVMGDHRDVSADSRYHLADPDGGFVPESDVVGRAVAVIWPISHWRTLPVQSLPVQSSTAAAPTSDQSLRQVSSAAASGPLLGELPLVMGLAATVPRFPGRRRTRARPER